MIQSHQLSTGDNPKDPTRLMCAVHKKIDNVDDTNMCKNIVWKMKTVKV